MVKDEESAYKAIENIVTQGEGFQGPYVDDDLRQLSHFHVFRNMAKNSGMNYSCSILSHEINEIIRFVLCAPRQTQPTYHRLPKRAIAKDIRGFRCIVLLSPSLH